MNKISDRTDNSQLPTLAETHRIKEVEAVRDVDPENRERHFVDFKPIVALSDACDQPSELFGMSIEGRTVTDEDVAGVHTWLEGMIKRLSEPSAHATLRPHMDGVYDYLAEEDRPKPVDITIVFGGKSDARPIKAAELYQEGLTKMLLCCGRGPEYSGDIQKTEAETYAEVLREKGVPEDAIIIEPNSLTIPDNVRSSLNLLDHEGVAYKSLALVTSPFCQRRTWACVKKYVPPETVITRINSQATDIYSRDHWSESEQGIRVILNEYVKMAIAITHNDA